MLLSLVLHMYSMRCVVPAAVLLGTAPTYVLAWGAWRLLSAFLPSRFYQAVDDRLYCIYQSMVLFFFENYTGVQVRLCPRPAPARPPARRTCRPSLSTWAPRGRRRWPQLGTSQPRRVLEDRDALQGRSAPRTRAVAPSSHLGSRFTIFP